MATKTTKPSGAKSTGVKKMEFGNTSKSSSSSTHTGVKKMELSNTGKSKK